METKFSDGDTVWLRSGGPKMVVECTDTNNKVHLCCWFDGNVPRKEGFHPWVLSHSDPDGSPMRPMKRPVPSEGPKKSRYP